MAKLVFGMNVSLDGYVDHLEFGPSPALFRHFVTEAEGQAGSVYGRRVYELMHIGTKIIRNGTRIGGPSLPRGGSSRNGLSPAR